MSRLSGYLAVTSATCSATTGSLYTETMIAWTVFMMWTPLVPFLPLIPLSLADRNMYLIMTGSGRTILYSNTTAYFVPPTVMPDMGMTDMLPKFVAICFSSGAVTPNPALVAYTCPWCSGLIYLILFYLRCRLVIINITRSLCSPLNTMLQVSFLCCRGEEPSCLCRPIQDTKALYVSTPPPDIIVGVFDIIIFYLHPLPCFFPLFPIFLALLGTVQVLHKQVFPNSGLPPQKNKQHKHGLRPPHPLKFLYDI